MGSNAEKEPAKLLLPYLQRADELQKHEPLVAYYCRLYAMERGLKFPPKEKTKTTNALLISLMNQLEKHVAGLCNMDCGGPSFVDPMSIASYSIFQSYPGFSESSLPSALGHYHSYYQSSDVAYSHQPSPPASGYSSTVLVHQQQTIHQLPSRYQVGTLGDYCWRNGLKIQDWRFHLSIILVAWPIQQF